MNKKSKVILLPCNSYREEIVYENLEIGLELLGGIENIVGKEESVLLKPNLLKKAEVDKAVITHPTVVGMFARLMREKGYQDMALADSCGNGTTSKVIHGTGMDMYLEKLDIPVIDYTTGIHVDYSKGIQAKEFILPKELLEKDWEMIEEKSYDVPGTEGRILLGFKNRKVLRGTMTKEKIIKLSSLL